MGMRKYKATLIIVDEYIDEEETPINPEKIEEALLWIDLRIAGVQVESATVNIEG